MTITITRLYLHGRGAAVPSVRRRKSVPPTAEEKAAADRRVLEDIERTRRPMEQFREEEKQDA